MTRPTDSELRLVDTEPEVRRRRRWPYAAVVLAGLLSATVLIAVTGHGGGHRPAVPATGNQAHTQAGARDAAMSMVRNLGSSAMGDANWRKQYVTSIADPDMLAGLLAQGNSAAGGLDTGAGLDPTTGAPVQGGKYLAVSAPISDGTRVTAYSPKSASVAVWTVGIAGTAGPNSTSPVISSWTTDTIALRWEGSQWRYVGGTTVAGPAPTQGAQPASSYQDLLAVLGVGPR